MKVKITNSSLVTERITASEWTWIIRRVSIPKSLSVDVQVMLFQPGYLLGTPAESAVWEDLLRKSHENLSVRRRIRDAARTSRDVDAETRVQADEVLCGSSSREREGVTGCDPMILSRQGHRKPSLYSSIGQK